MGAGDPVISVDTKKKELVGPYKNGGREWEPKGAPAQVKTHDFLDRQGPGKAIPYGIYDVAANTGWVSVGTDHDTAAFAVASIRRWWQARGSHDYPQAARLLITADAGGSNGYRTRAWKTELAALAAETGLEITVCHMPPGTSKWNKIEHRLFSHICMNWRGRPLNSHDVIVNSIKATTTETGLTVHAELDSGTYNTGVKFTDTDIDALPMHRHRFHGDWNYTLHPQHGDTAGTARSAGGLPPQSRVGGLRNPELTGMTEPGLDELVDQLSQKLDELREHGRSQQRGGDRIRARGAGAKDKLTRRQSPGHRALPAQTRNPRLDRTALRSDWQHPHPGRSPSPAPSHRARLHHPSLDSQVPLTRRRHRIPHEEQAHRDQVSMLILCEPLEGV